MTPTETLARLLEESGAQIVLPNEAVRKAFAAMEAEVAKLTRERDAALEDANEITWRGLLQKLLEHFQVQYLSHHTGMVKRAIEQLAELRADRERLDWLLDDNNQAVEMWIWDKASELCPVDTDESADTGKWGRAAIDEARKAGA